MSLPPRKKKSTHKGATTNSSYASCLSWPNADTCALLPNQLQTRVDAARPSISKSPANLIFEFFKPGEWAWPMALSGHLRCVGLGPMTLLLPEELPSDLPGGMNFRLVGLQDVHCGLQQTLDRCVGSLETFTCGTVKRVREEPTHIVTQANPTGSFLQGTTNQLTSDYAGTYPSNRGQNCIAKVESSSFPRKPRERHASQSPSLSWS